MATNKKSQNSAVDSVPAVPTVTAKRYVSKLDKTVCRLSNSQEAWVDGNVITLPNTKLSVEPRVVGDRTFYNIWVL